MGKICVLRLGHRMNRDQRVTTHVFLAARALGATEGVLSGERDDKMLVGIARVAELWGGDFKVDYVPDWRKFLVARKKAGWKIAHLTMYGEDFRTAMPKLRKGNLCVIVGAGKVPHEAYELSDFNLAVANQPHSEISALALFLDRYFAGKEFAREFSGKLKIAPNKCGKSVIRVTNG